MKIKRITFYGIVSAVYVILCLLMGSFSYGPIQIRIAEVLMLLCIFDSRFIMPLTLGCFLANLIGLFMGLNYLTLDVVFGSLATLISGILMFRFRRIKYRNIELLSLIIPGIVNGVIIAIELTLYTSLVFNLSLFLTYFVYIFVSEILSTVLLGLLLYKPLKSIALYICQKE